ncbi:MAG: OmpA family protein [Campylobacterota bacterium]|nr:OmpA family protein [Campylobacterota bacterium]
MHYLFIILSLSIYLHASEFSYIQPISVEKAPIQDIVTPIKKDSDLDGVSDDIDICPDTLDYFAVDDFGCPKTAILDVAFRSNQHTISNKLSKQLKSFSKFLEENISYQIIIYGHTDNVGDPQDNIILSQKRAQAVKEVLQENGISSVRITAIGRGDKDPIADNRFAEGRKKNRRIKILLLK